MSCLNVWRSTGVCFLSFVALGACGEQKQSEAPAIRPVLSVTVESPVTELSQTFTGSVQPRYQASLGFQVFGRMLSRDARVGEAVAKGQQLATIDPRLARFALVSAQSDLASAQAQLINAQGEDDRKQKLIKTGVASQAQVDAAKAARQTAEARVTQARASLEKVRMQLEYATLKSDVDGVVVSWQAQVGQVLSAGQNVVTIARPDVRDAVFDIPDAMTDKFRPGVKFTITLQMDESIFAAAEVRDVAPKSDAATRTRRVWLTLQNPPDAFRLGATVRITLVDRQEPHIDLPETAILDKDGRSLVWLIGSNYKARSQPVTIASRQRGMAEITGGLRSGDRVIIAGVHSLSEGQPIKASDQSSR